MEELSKNNQEIEEPDDNVLTKPKKPRSEKQQEAFKETMRKRAENIEIRKNEKLVKASEVLINSKREQGYNKEFMKQVKKPVYQSESESEEEIIIVKAKPKKKKVKKIIIEESDSDSSGSDGGKRNRYNQPEQVSIQRTVQKPIFNPNNFFI